MEKSVAGPTRGRTEHPRKNLQETYDKAMLALRANENLASLLKQGRESMLFDPARAARGRFRYLGGEAVAVVGMARRTMCYLPAKALPSGRSELIGPIKAVIEDEPRFFGYHTVAVCG